MALTIHITSDDYERGVRLYIDNPSIEDQEFTDKFIRGTEDIVTTGGSQWPIIVNDGVDEYSFERFLAMIKADALGR